MPTLYEKYRPQDFNEVLGQDKAVKILQIQMNLGIGGNSYWITGNSGTGKTTLALILASKLCSPENIYEVNGSDFGLIDFRLMQNKLANNNLFQSEAKNHKCLLINEAHGMSKSLVLEMLTYMERTNTASIFQEHLPSNCFIIFTTTKIQEKEYLEGLLDANPLISRCVKIQLTNQKLAEKFAARAKEIAEAEGLGGKPLDQYIRLSQKCNNNMRMILQEIASGAMIDDTEIEFDTEPEREELELRRV